MELSPQTLHAVEFREARRGGYNTRDVDDFIERVAAGVAQLNERLRDATARAESADARVAEAQRQAEEVRRRPMTPEATETDETLRRTLVLAQRTADATIKEAKEEANRVLSEAREEAARTRAEAEADARRGAEGARATAQAEVETLITNRDMLKADLEALTKRLSDQRANLRSGIGELQRLLDDPAALKPLGVPALADVERPAPLDAFGAETGNGDAESGNGRTPEAEAPFVAGAQVAALQEPPVPDLGPPTQPVPFALGGGEARSPWQPADLRTDDDEPLGPPPAPPAPPGANGGGITDPGSRPSEWGKAVFDPERAEGDGTRFGRRR
jgi:DivIVA domain-containing protein